MGGTERVTDILSSELQKGNKHQCFLAYFEDISPSLTQTYFKERIHLKSRKNYTQLISFIINQNINIIIVQGEFGIVKPIRIVFPEIKIIFAHHFYPGFENTFYTLSYVYNIWNNNKSIKNFIRVLLFPLYKWKHTKNIRSNYKDVVTYATYIVLLSQKLITPYIRYARIKEISKFRIIPNALSYNTIFLKNEIYNKEKIVLIISRLVEHPKRISLALKAWHQVMEDERFKNWNLVIIGSGENEKDYKQYVQKLQIPNIKFIGKIDPQEYLKKSSILLMTSQIESWGLVITEAQQFGVVPIAYDSYPTIHEIIHHKKNGILISEGDLKKYVHSMQLIMNDDEKRKQYAFNCLESCRKFSKEEIIKQWEKLFFE